MTVREVNVITGEETLRYYTQEELDAIVAQPALDLRVVRLAAIDQEAQLTPRAFRELVILMTEGFKAATGGALDLTTVPGVAQVYALEAEAQALRSGA